MRRPVSMTLLAVGLGWYGFVATLGGLIALTLTASAPLPLPIWFGLPLVATGLLGLRATWRIWRQQPDADRAILAFTAMGALVPLCIYGVLPVAEQDKVVVPALASTVLWVAVGIWMARKARRAPTGAA